MKDNVSTKPELIEEKEPLHMVGSGDSEECKRADELFRTLANSSPVGVYIIQDRRFQYVNPQFQKYQGRSRGELLDMAPLSLVLPEDRDMVRENAIKMLKGESSLPYEYRAFTKTGETRWIMETVAPIQYRGRRATLGNYMDITEHKQAEEALRKEKERAELYLDIAEVMLARIDADERISLINNRGCKILGYQEGELVDKNWFDTLVPQRMRGEVRQVFYQLMSGDVEPVEYFENPLLTKNGEERLIVFHNTVIREADGRIVGVLLSGEDVTELRKIQEQLQHSQLLASLGEMTAGIAHEVNNPLGSILLYSELLMASDDSLPIRKDLKVIHDEAKRAARVMTALLTYGRRSSPRMRCLNLHRIIKKVVNMRRYEERVHNITTSSNLLDDPLHVIGDSSQLMQVFMNLMLNAEEALKKSDGGNIIIDTQRDRGWARISIADDGTGIPQGDLKQVFYPFFTTKQVGAGTGLGLSTCYGIITAHNGLIRAENNEMGGATFIVELPLAEVRRRGRKASPKHNTGRKMPGGTGYGN